jgi:hypothetical protein
LWNWNFIQKLFSLSGGAPSAFQKIQLKPWPEPTAWAFQNLRPGQSCGQAITWAWLGLAHSLKLSHAHHYFQSQPIV